VAYRVQDGQLMILDSSQLSSVIGGVDKPAVTPFCADTAKAIGRLKALVKPDSPDNVDIRYSIKRNQEDMAAAGCPNS
jgi:hypothetical protein